ncbi:MAG: hypothetical protein GX045_03935, partial [Clostridiaceae bacterium]|nr:hypothetical protein [Clostridiaceae bacterium]
MFPHRRISANWLKKLDTTLLAMLELSGDYLSIFGEMAELVLGARLEIVWALIASRGFESH